MLKLVYVALFAFFIPLAYSDQAQEIKSLKHEISVLKKKVDVISAQALSNNDISKHQDKQQQNKYVNNSKIAYKQVLKDPKQQDPGKGKFHIGGFVQMVALYDCNQLGYFFNRDYTYIPQLVYKDQTDMGKTRKGLRSHVKQSRIVITYDDYGKFLKETYPMRAFIDIDFYNGKEGNGIFTHSFQPRMRSAYFKFGNVEVGLDWSLFMDIGNFPVTVDFGSATGTCMLRQPQFRYTHKITKFLSLVGSIENSDSTFVEKDGASKYTRTLDNAGGDYRASSIFPDFIGALLYNNGRLNGGLKIVFANTRVAPNTDNNGATVRSVAFGGSFGYRLNNGDKLIGHVNFGNGLARYLHEAACYGLYYDKEENRFYKHFAFGFTFGLTHFWRPNLHTSVTFGRTMIRLAKNILEQPQTIEVRDGGTTKTINNPTLVAAEDNFFRYCTSFHANLIWNINKRVEVALEYLSHRKAPARFKHPIKINRQKAVMDRVLMHFKMNFN